MPVRCNGRNKTLNLFALACCTAAAAAKPVREAVSYRGLFTAGWLGVREKHCSWLEIYDRLRASEQAVYFYR